jgi:hypothetical protein
MTPFKMTTIIASFIDFFMLIGGISGAAEVFRFNSGGGGCLFKVVLQKEEGKERSWGKRYIR